MRGHDDQQIGARHPHMGLEGVGGGQGAGVLEHLENLRGITLGLFDLVQQGFTQRGRLAHLMNSRIREWVTPPLSTSCASRHRPMIRGIGAARMLSPQQPLLTDCCHSSTPPRA